MAGQSSLPPLQPGSACQPCRSRKTKCDGVQPACGRCSRLKKTCSYEPTPREKPTLRLERRVHELEAQIDALSRKSTKLDSPSQSVLSHPLMRNGFLLPPPMTLDVLPYFPQRIWPTTNVPEHQFYENEAYSTVVPRQVIENALSNWDPAFEVPLDLSEILIRIFLPFRVQFHYHKNINQLLTEFNLPLGHTRRVGPALINCMHLAACSVAGFPRFERYFLNRARRALETSLSSAENITDFIWGSLILGLYYSRAGRLIESYNTISSTVRFAIGWGFHLTSADANVSVIEGVLGTDKEERETLWATLYLADRAFTCSSDFPTAVPLDCGPCQPQISQLTELSSFEADSSPLAKLKMCEPLNYDVSNDSVLILKVKLLVLNEAIRSLARATKTASDLTISRLIYKHLHVMLQTYTSAFPPLSTPIDIAPGEVIADTCPIPSLFLIRVIAYACAIILYSIPHEENGALEASEGDQARAYTLRLDAAYGMSELVSRVCYQDGHVPAVWADVILTNHAYCAAEVLVREIQRNHPPAFEEQEARLAKASRAFGHLVEFLTRLTAHHPMWATCIEDLRRQAPMHSKSLAPSREGLDSVSLFTL